MELRETKRTVCLADVEAKRIDWLWEPYVAMGKVTCLEGDPGIGKSWITLAMAVAVSNGTGLPECVLSAPSPVLIFSAEDDLSDTIKPRLETMGADHSRIFAYLLPVAFNEKGLSEIEQAIIQHNPALVFFDPLMAFVGEGVDIHRANQTRHILTKLKEIAERRNCAIVIVRHLTKGSKDKGIYRGMGSIDITGAVRSVLLVGVDPSNDAKRAIIHIKSNLSKKGPSLGYRLEEDSFTWTGRSDLTAAQVLASDLNIETESKVERAKKFLSEFLEKGPVLMSEVVNMGKAEGISEATMRRAKKAIGAVSKPAGREGEKGAEAWFWQLAKGTADLDDQTDMIEDGHLNVERTFR